MMRCSEFNIHIHTWLRDYDKIQSVAVILLYIQIGCALIGSLGALYTGVSVINLGIALFALVAIENSSQRLGRTYAVLLFSAILLDVLWLILFSHEIWYMPSEIHGKFAMFSVKLTLLMQIVGFSMRSLSSILWIQMYRLGSSQVDSSCPQDGEDLRNSFINPATPAFVRPNSGMEDGLGGSIYDPVYYSSLFSDNQDEGLLLEGENRFNSPDRSISDAPLLKSSLGRSFQSAIHVSSDYLLDYLSHGNPSLFDLLSSKISLEPYKMKILYLIIKPYILLGFCFGTIASQKACHFGILLERNIEGRLRSF
ncbi:hypothetical protein SSX86_019664 [Deinandra increscens subsp. villosa]|uniref:Uncharacterized protein n=1 Tax=Deinandra increscens subsp. villosa TaxID=3103831 RepID=A0AAP0CXJ8_9ASTR